MHNIHAKCTDLSAHSGVESFGVENRGYLNGFGDITNLKQGAILLPDVFIFEIVLGNMINTVDVSMRLRYFRFLALGDRRTKRSSGASVGLKCALILYMTLLFSSYQHFHWKIIYDVKRPVILDSKSSYPHIFLFVLQHFEF